VPYALPPKLGFVKLQEVLAGAPVIGISGDPDVEVWGVAYDSRRVQAGDLFACVRGALFDGHRFAHEAVTRGAVAVLVENPVDLPVPQAQVQSVRRAMSIAAHELWGRSSEKLALIGVTGTNGKTTVTHFLESMATAAGRASAVVGTVGARFADVEMPLSRTTPEGPDFHRLVHDMVEAGVELAAVEVSSHALAQERVAGAHFSVAAFTNLSRDHLDFHVDMESYFMAKAGLFTPEYTRHGVVMIDDRWGVRLAKLAEERGLDVWRVSSTSTDAEVIASRLETGRGLGFTLETPVGRGVLRLGMPGSFNIANAAVAAAGALAAGIPLEAVEEGASRLERVPGRFEIVEQPGRPRVIVDYAHTPLAVTALLHAARELLAGHGRVLLVIGAGGERDQSKRLPMGQAAGDGADHVIITNDNPRGEDPSTIAAELRAGVALTGASWEVELDRREALRRALERARHEDVVVIAGKGHEKGQEANGVVVPFDDRQVAAEELVRWSDPAQEAPRARGALLRRHENRTGPERPNGQ
jgi:UDP-N-acetylmuramoyl-L-alanyl-D-glutamate--2,6-diaminopimelate ligase